MPMRTILLTTVLVLSAAAQPALAGALATAPAQLREVALTYPAESVVEASRQATVAAQVSGRVVQVMVDAGDRVTRGQVLMRIDEREAVQGVAAAQAGVVQAQAALTNATATVERTRNLRDKNFVSQAALDQAEATHRAAVAQLKAAEAGRGQAGTVRSFTVVTSPLTGVVAQRLTEEGEMAAPGRPLLALFEPGELRVVASIPQYKLADLPAQLKAKVEFPERRLWVDAVRVERLPVADARTHTVRVRVYLPADVAGVVPGMFARVHLVLGSARKLVVSADAVVRRGEVTAVYVQAADGSLTLRQVRLGEPVADGGIEVLAGLADGETVVADPVQGGMALLDQRRTQNESMKK